MADNGTLELKINADASPLDKIEQKMANTAAKASKGISLNIATSAASAGIDKIDRALTSIATKAASITLKGIAAGATGIVTGLGASVKAAGELEQQVGGSEAVFGDYAETIQKQSKTAYKSMGKDQAGYMQTINKMGALMQGSGVDQAKSMELSSDAMQRAADVASIMGVDIDFAMESIAGAAKGNFTMMDNLGVAMSDTSLNAYALEKGLGKTTQQMTQAEKVTLAMEMFMEKSAYAAGNYAKENDTLAGSFQTAKAAFKNFLATGEGADEALEAAMHAGGIAAKMAKELAPKLAAGIKKAFEKLKPMIPGLLADLFSGVAGTLDSIFGTSIFTDLTKGLTDFLKGASFDDLLNGFRKLAKSLAIAFIGFKALSIGKKVFGGLNSMMKIFNKSSKGGSSANPMQSIADGFSSLQKSAGIALVIASIALLAFALKGIAELGTTAVVPLLTFAAVIAILVGTFALFGKALTTNMTGIAVFAIAVSLLAFAMAPIAQSGTEGAIAMAVFGAVIAILVAVFALFGPLLNAAIPGMLAFGVTMLLIGVAAALATPMIEALPPVIDSLSQAFNSAVEAISQAIDLILTSVGNLVEKIADGVSKIVETVGTTLVNVMKQASDSITDVVDSISGGVQGILEKIADIFEAMGNAALNAGKGVKEMAKGIKILVGLNLVDLSGTLLAVSSGLAAIALSSLGLQTVGKSMKLLVDGLLKIVDNGMKLAVIIPMIMQSLMQLGAVIPTLIPHLMLLQTTMTTVMPTFQTFATTALTAMATLMGIAVFTTFASSAFMALDNAVMMSIRYFEMFKGSVNRATNELLAMSSSLIVTARNAFELAVQLTDVTLAMAVMEQQTNSLIKTLNVLRTTVIRLRSAFVAAMNAMKSAALSMMNSVISAFSRMASAAVSIVNNMVARVASAMAGMASAVNRAMQQSINVINSYQAAFQNSGQLLGVAIANGIRSQTSTIMSVIDDIARQANSKINATVNGAKGASKGNKLVYGAYAENYMTYAGVDNNLSNNTAGITSMNAVQSRVDTSSSVNVEVSGFMETTNQPITVMLDSNVLARGIFKPLVKLFDKAKYRR